MSGWCPLSISLPVLTSLHPSVNQSIRLYVFVFPLLLFFSVIPYLIIALVFILDYCYDCNNTSSHLHYLKYLESVDILGAYRNDGEVDNVW